MSVTGLEHVDDDDDDDITCNIVLSTWYFFYKLETKKNLSKKESPKRSELRRNERLSIEN